MSCTKRFMNFQWEHHSWRQRVIGTEIRTGQETDMWARSLPRDYVRCDKREVCEACGKVGREVSCCCDVARAERCPQLRSWNDEPRTAAV